MGMPSGNISETLFIPLLGRADASKKFPSLLYDRESIRIVDASDYDFSRVVSSLEYYNLASAVRAANFDRELHEYIEVHPEATIVSIGSGLDTTFFRVDNGKILWYDLDLPDIIELRENYISSNKRVKTLSCSCFDYSWISQIDWDTGKGIFFIVGGVFYYFHQEQVSEFLKKVAENFSGGRLVFDATSKQGLKISNRYVKKTGNKGAEMYFGLNNAKKYAQTVSSKIRVGAAYPFYSRIKIDKSWTFDTKFRMKFSDFFNMVQLVRLDFC